MRNSFSLSLSFFNLLHVNHAISVKSHISRGVGGALEPLLKTSPQDLLPNSHDTPATKEQSNSDTQGPLTGDVISGVLQPAEVITDQSLIDSIKAQRLIAFDEFNYAIGSGFEFAGVEFEKLQNLCPPTRTLESDPPELFDYLLLHIWMKQLESSNRAGTKIAQAMKNLTILFQKPEVAEYAWYNFELESSTFGRGRFGKFDNEFFTVYPADSTYPLLRNKPPTPRQQGSFENVLSANYYGKTYDFNTQLHTDENGDKQKKFRVYPMMDSTFEPAWMGRFGTRELGVYASGLNKNNHAEKPEVRLEKNPTLRHLLNDRERRGRKTGGDD